MIDALGKWPFVAPDAETLAGARLPRLFAELPASRIRRSSRELQLCMEASCYRHRPNTCQMVRACNFAHIVARARARFIAPLLALIGDADSSVLELLQFEADGEADRDRLFAGVDLRLGNAAHRTRFGHHLAMRRLVAEARLAHRKDARHPLAE